MGRQAFVLQNCAITQSFPPEGLGFPYSLQTASVYSCKIKYICRFPRGSLCYISVYREHIFVCWTVTVPVYIEACCLLVFPVGHERLYSLSWFSLSGAPDLASVSPPLLSALNVFWFVFVGCVLLNISFTWLFHFLLRASDQNARVILTCWKKLSIYKSKQH